MPKNQNRSQEHRSRRVAYASVGLIGVLACSAMLGGCQKTALRPDDHRSQYDRYDRSRSQRAQPFLEDEFGRRTPNLSERLLDRGD